MSDLDEKELELFMKQMIRQIMKEQLSEVNTDQQKNNNSYVFLENRTLNMVILYMLMKEERSTNSKKSEGTNRPSEMETVEKLEQVIADNQKEFEKILTLLKDKL